MNIYCVIPFKDEPHLTANVANLAARDSNVKSVILCDNGSSAESISTLHSLIEFACENTIVSIIDCSDLNIYGMWNFGWRQAIQMNGNENLHIAFLNNDIEFLDGTLSAMSRVLNDHEDVWISYPNYDRSNASGLDENAGITFTSGTYRHGGMSGWIFMVQSSIASKENFPWFDEQFEWWCGDDDFAFIIEKLGGRQARLLGYPSEHLVEATASNGNNNWTHEAKSRDMVKLSNKWPTK